jgi:hypothetical protein
MSHDHWELVVYMERKVIRIFLSFCKLGQNNLAENEESTIFWSRDVIDDRNTIFVAPRQLFVIRPNDGWSWQFNELKSSRQKWNVDGA